LVIVLAGPTAVGKSDVAATICSSTIATSIYIGHRRAAAAAAAAALEERSEEEEEEERLDDARSIRGHVISADSVQAYRDANIGSNKPTECELNVTPHHLIDVVDIVPPASASFDIASMVTTTPTNTSTYNAADWMDDARYVIRSLAPLPPDDDDEGYDDDDLRLENGEMARGGERTDVDGSIARRRERIDESLRRGLVATAAPPDSIATAAPTVEPIATTTTTTTVDDGASSTPTVLPVVVGGTMMYLQWLVRGMPDAVRPTDDASRRAYRVIDELRRISSSSRDDGGGGGGVSGVGTVGRNGAMSSTTNTASGEEEREAERTDVDSSSWEVASARVSSLGPLFARRVQKLPGRDWYRLRRLLEVAYTIASAKMGNGGGECVESSDGGVGGEEEEDEEMTILRNLTEEEVYTGLRSGRLSDLGYDVRCFFLCPSDRMTHFHVVDDRCERMLMSGLLRETCDLFLSGAMPDESQVARAIGYRQALRYLRRDDARRDDVDAFASFVDDFMSATRQYAKKQMQWFRRDDEFAFVPICMDDERDTRVGNAAEVISKLCMLRRVDFDSELRPRVARDEYDDIGPPSLSARTKLDNERQGKTMKFFISRRVHLVDGTDEFNRVMAEADECTRLVQGFVGEI
jgi:tRNA dimethylallyltransferase